jgi:hypothetical protein
VFESGALDKVASACWQPAFSKRQSKPELHDPRFARSIDATRVRCADVKLKTGSLLLAAVRLFADQS